MWIFSKTGFHSIVRHNERSDHFLVRARTRADLEDMLDSFDGDHSLIEEDPKADYRWRVVLPEMVVAAFLGAQLHGIDYTTSVKTHLDKGEHARHSAMMRVWTAMMSLQSAGGRYSWNRDRVDGPTLGSLVGTRPVYEPDDWHWDDDQPTYTSTDLAQLWDEDDLFAAEEFVSVDRAHLSLDDADDLWEVNVWNAMGEPTTVQTFRDIADANALADAMRKAALSWGVDPELLT